MPHYSAKPECARRVDRCCPYPGDASVTNDGLSTRRPSALSRTRSCSRKSAQRSYPGMFLLLGREGGCTAGHDNAGVHVERAVGSLAAQLILERVRSPVPGIGVTSER
jgi:hypothetical protein